MALPMAIASKIFRRVPPPMRNGTTNTAADFRYSMTEGTPPVNRRNPAISLGACSRGKFVVLWAGEAYDTQARSLNRKLWMNASSGVARNGRGRSVEFRLR